MSKVVVYFVLVGVHPGKPRSDLRRAVQALRKEGFVANVASGDSILAQADAIREGKTTDGKAATG